MSGVVLTLNTGSSSIKFAVFEIDGGAGACLIRGEIEGLGAEVSFSADDGAGRRLIERRWETGEGPRDHVAALASVIDWIDDIVPATRVEGIGHRVVHGGLDFVAPVVVDAHVAEALARLSPLAPLHQPHNLAGIAAARTAFPGAPQVACFDTAFHRGQPFVSDTFALPRHLYDEGVRRYGFHGLSYEYVTRRLAEIAPTLAAGRVIVAHLGNGASMCAVRGGRSVASTMGFSALDGLPMGTRCGQVDPGVLLFLMQERGMDAAAMSRMLYKESGLKGLSALSHDMRVLEASDDPRAAEAIDYFVARVRHEIGGLAAVLEGVDAIAFAGGIGENASRIRARILGNLEWLGVRLDPEANARHATCISTAASAVAAFVVPTDEEAMIARHTIAALGLVPASAVTAA